MTRRRLLAAGLAALAGCAAAPPAPPPTVPLPAHWTATPMPEATAGAGGQSDRAQSLAGPGDGREDWWSAFGGPRVDMLVRGALAANPGMAAAAATLRQARELVLAQSATRWPTLAVGIGAVQAHGANAGVLDSGAPRARTALLSASYAPDLFGLNADDIASAKAQEDATRWQLVAARLTLAGAVLNALATEKAAARVEQLTQRLAEVDAATLAILRTRESLGDVAAGAVWAQVQQLHDRQAQLASARLQTAQARDLLASLMGDAPANFVEPALEFDELALPDLALRLPGEVIARRPDVQMAAAQLRSADAAHQAAIAALLPQVTLGGDAGGVSATLRHLFDPASVAWDLALSATQSVFDAGAQRHRVAAAQALADAQSAQYRAAIVGAFRDVADGLEAVRHDAQADVEAIARARAAQRQVEIAEKSRDLGQISRQDVLAARSEALQSQILQVQARTNRLVDAVDLMVSLGGSADPDAVHAGAIASSSTPIAQP
jgi:NodT family efflux transporter outer membrane factor (OMF) lipoprotein